MKKDFSVTAIQQWMQHILLPHGGDNAPGNEIQVADVVLDSSRLSAQRHLDIYRHSYTARLRECMRSQFPALAHALGTELFEMFADQYLDIYPSGSYTLNDLGVKFAAFLDETRPDETMTGEENWPDFMIRLAEFEFSLATLFDAEIPSIYQYATESTPDELLKLIPGINLYQHNYPICDYYLSFSRGEKPGLPLPADSYCAVSRQQYRLALQPLRPAQYHFLNFLQQDGKVAAAKDRLIATQGCTREQLEELWPLWKQHFVAAGFLAIEAEII